MSPPPRDKMYKAERRHAQIEKEKNFKDETKAWETFCNEEGKPTTHRNMEKPEILKS